jgi:predicted phage-related endonuclease
LGDYEAVTVVSLDARRATNIGGSEAAAVLDCDPFLSATMLAARKLGLAPPEPESDAMRYGTLLQGPHAELLEADGYEVMPAPTDQVAHPGYSWWVGHPDCYGVIEGGRGVVELKARGVAPSEATWLRDEIQALHYLACTSLEVALVSVLHVGYGGLQRSERTIERDDEALAMMLDRYQIFRKIVRRGGLPVGDGSPSAREFYRTRPLAPDRTEHLSKSQAVRVRETLRLSKAGLGHARAARFHRERSKWHDAEQERHWQAVQHEMGEATLALSPLDDEPLAEWSDETTSAFDRKAFERDHPVLAARYTSRKPRRRWLPK